MNRIITLEPDDDDRFRKLFEQIKDWSREHQVGVGVAEMALGSAMIAYGVNTGAIQMGADIVASACGRSVDPKVIAGLTGSTAAAITAVGCKLIGGIGIAAAGGAVAVPAVILVGGAAWVFGATGYALTEAINSFLEPSINALTLFTGGSLLTIGLALILDGAYRVLPERLKEKIHKISSKFRDGIITLVKCATKIIASSLSKLKEVYDKAYDMLQKALNNRMIRKGVSGTIIIGGTTSGALLGTTAAVGTVTVLGSHTLGAVALGLGLVSAPIWPVFLAGAGGAALGLGVWCLIKKLLKLSSDEDLLFRDLICGEKHHDKAFLTAGMDKQPGRTLLQSACPGCFVCSRVTIRRCP